MKISIIPTLSENFNQIKRGLRSISESTFVSAFDARLWKKIQKYAVCYLNEKYLGLN